LLSDIGSFPNSNWWLVPRRVPFASKSYLTHGIGQEISSGKLGAKERKREREGERLP
jgi:hypothetical protein